MDELPHRAGDGQRAEALAPDSGFPMGEGLANPKGETVLRLAEVLEASLDELISPYEPEQTAAALGFAEHHDSGRTFSLVSSFEKEDRQALKIFIEALATKNRVKSALRLTYSVATSSPEDFSREIRLAAAAQL